LFCCILGCLLFPICIEFVFSCTVLFVSISQVIGCEDRLRNDLGYIVSSGALNSTPTEPSRQHARLATRPEYSQCRRREARVRRKLMAGLGDGRRPKTTTSCHSTDGRKDARSLHTPSSAYRHASSADLFISKSFIRYGSNACWIHTVTMKYKYKLDNKT